MYRNHFKNPEAQENDTIIRLAVVVSMLAGILIGCCINQAFVALWQHFTHSGGM